MDMIMIIHLVFGYLFIIPVIPYDVGIAFT